MVKSANPKSATPVVQILNKKLLHLAQQHRIKLFDMLLEMQAAQIEAMEAKELGGADPLVDKYLADLTEARITSTAIVNSEKQT